MEPREIKTFDFQQFYFVYGQLTLFLFWLEGAAAGGVTPTTAGVIAAGDTARVMTAGDTAGVKAAGDTAGNSAGAGPSTAATAPGCPWSASARLASL